MSVDGRYYSHVINKLTFEWRICNTSLNSCFTSL